MLKRIDEALREKIKEEKKAREQEEREKEKAANAAVTAVKESLRTIGWEPESVTMIPYSTARSWKGEWEASLELIPPGFMLRNFTTTTRVTVTLNDRLSAAEITGLERAINALLDPSLWKEIPEKPAEPQPEPEPQPPPDPLAELRNAWQTIKQYLEGEGF